MSKIKTYVGSDGKLHFVDSAGADSVLPFSSVPSNYKAVVTNKKYSETATMTGFEVGKLVVIDIFNTSGVQIKSGLNMMYNSNINIAGTGLQLIIGVATSTTITIYKYADYYIENAGYLY